MELLRNPIRLVALLLLVIPAPPGGVAPPYARVGVGVPPLVVGVHAPNQPWREADYERVAQGRFDTLKMMSYHPPEAYGRLRASNPATQFVVRLDTPWNELPPPDAFAAAHAPHLRALVEAGYYPWVEIGNEPNLELHPLAEGAFARWYEAALGHLRAAVPEAKYGFPGLAQDRREGGWWETNAPGIQASDWLAVHAYWTDEREMLDPRRGLRFTAAHRRFPRLPMVVTEAGNHGFGVSAAQRAREYARFVRTVARLPYVRAVHFFILSGTPEWRRFFFDDAATTAVRQASREPAPVLDGLRDAGGSVVALLQPLITGGAPAARSGHEPAQDPLPVPTPAPFARRPLLADPAPGLTSAPDMRYASDGASPGLAPAAGRWVALPTGPGPRASLRTASDYFATDLAVRVDVAPPEPDTPFALQLAETDLFAVERGDAGATGFALLWDGQAWRLQYYRAGEVEADLALVDVPPAPHAAGGASNSDAVPVVDQALDGWYRVEVALEARSAAAWVWRRGAAQPGQPNAVFAPPEAAAGDGARPRVLFLPDHPIANVVLEGATRHS